MNTPLPDGFSDRLLSARLRLLRLHHEARAGHMGGNFSCLEAILTLHLCVMSEADRFVLSKGHAAGALYIALWAQKRLSEETLSCFGREGSVLPGHPSGSGVPGLSFPTGSLGHGPSLSAGMALALKRKRLPGSVYCLCSDGEWQEGSAWEGLNFAVRRKLDNLVILVDQNGWQGFGRTREVMGVEDLAPRFATFGALVATVDGHQPQAILEALAAPGKEDSPRVLVLRTRKGRGLHCEDTLESHYLPLSDAQYEAAVRAARQDALTLRPERTQGNSGKNSPGRKEGAL
jgi:transketolase